MAKCTNQDLKTAERRLSTPSKRRCIELSCFSALPLEMLQFRDRIVHYFTLLGHRPEILRSPTSSTIELISLTLRYVLIVYISECSQKSNLSLKRHRPCSCSWECMKSYFAKTVYLLACLSMDGVLYSMIGILPSRTGAGGLCQTTLQFRRYDSTKYIIPADSSSEIRGKPSSTHAGKDPCSRKFPLS